jgi:hypothetical protein
MPFYKITITLEHRVLKGVRELDQPDIDTAWLIFKRQAVQVYTEMKMLDFEVVMISKYSDDFRVWKLESQKPGNSSAEKKPHRSKIRKYRKG